MIEEEVDLEILIADRKPVLVSDKREADAQFEQNLAKVIEQTALQITFVGFASANAPFEYANPCRGDVSPFLPGASAPVYLE